MVTVYPAAPSAILAAVALAIGLICWPTGVARARLRELTGQQRRLAARRPGRWQPGLMAVVTAGVLVGACTAGVGGGIAGAFAAVVGERRVRARRTRRRRIAATADFGDALALLVGELRSGGHPAAAAAAVDSTEPEVQGALDVIGATARLGGDVPAALTRCASVSPAIGDELRRLAASWALADRHGVPLADLVDTVRVDLQTRVRFGRRVGAQLAGPRATAAVLATLPIIGVVLGELMGARPWHVLVGSVLGQALLVVGVGLTCAGLVWSDRITARAVAS